LTPCSPAAGAAADLPLKHNGVYIVTGGSGGLGFLSSEYLAEKFSARLVLVGRSAPGAEQHSKLTRLQSLGGQAIYLQADVARLEDMQAVVRETKVRFRALNGVIHAAGVNRDSFILKKTRQQMQEVLSSKVYGTINLDQATSAEELDLLVLFSSVAGVMGNPGQCDYAYANHFQDAFAESRERSRAAGARTGRTLSINWPLWEHGGMSISSSGVALLEEQTGMSPLPTAEGMRCWEELLRSDVSQAAVIYGLPTRIAAHVAGETPAASNSPVQKEGIDGATVLERTEVYLKTLLGEQIRLAPDRIDSHERLEAFGIDSIMISRFNASLQRDLGELPKTLLYEHETVAELAKYLVQEAQPALVALLGATRADVDSVPIPHQAAATHGLNGDVGAIAIVGVHAHFPQCKSLRELWDNLEQGRDLTGLVPADRWDWEEFYHPDPTAAAAGKIYCKWGGFLEDCDKFDAGFFGITPEEARVIDPQERLFLQSVWGAIEDAGYTRASLKKHFPKGRSANVGVYVGVTTNSYSLLGPQEWSHGNMVSPASLPWSIANRVSYFFDFNGPSLPVDTACSSSLVAVHLACESLRKQECQMAIAGGVNLYLHPAKYQSLCSRRMLSTGGECRSYGAGDDGFVPAEGVGALVLKPLELAVAHGDHIYAVIPGSAFSHSGRSNGYSAPNPNSQASLVAQALDAARIHPETIGYVEGHGTGTQLGDSLEITALTQAFRRQSTRSGFCALGSVKANIGHAESAAGMAAIAKVLLQLKHRQLVPTIHSEQVNPNIGFSNTPFYLQHALTPWESSSLHPRRALINSFGAGGVNACLILQEYEQSAPAVRSASTDPQLIVLSARDEDRLRAYVDELIAHLEREGETDLTNLAYTLQVGREPMPERMALVVTSVPELMQRLAEWSQHKSTAGIHRGSLDPRRGARRSSSASELSTLLEGRDLGGLAQAWTAGEEVDWDRLYSLHRPVRISLPSYPFAAERHWISDSRAPRRLAGMEGTARLHPLLSYNSSTLDEVSFCSVLCGHEFYAQDHKVNGQRVFPGSGFLEIACVSGGLAGANKVRKLQDVVWIQPLLFRDESQRLQICLKPADDSAEYVITSSDEHGERIVHSEGIVCFQDDADSFEAVAESLPVEALKGQCSRRIEGADLYRLFEQSGISYGPAFRPLQELYVGNSFALSRLSLAEHQRAGFDEFILHPCIIDGALQSVSGLIGAVEPAVPHLPFAIGEVQIIRPMAQTCYVHVEHSGLDEPGNGKVKKFDIRICNETGLVLVALRSFCVRALKPNTLSVPTTHHP
jgi:3-oxoacyl-(acyl-carrier-protein) synthase/NADP-dependent 3-hydroxy acid dehydrogenase YdfG